MSGPRTGENRGKDLGNPGLFHREDKMDASARPGQVGPSLNHFLIITEVVDMGYFLLGSFRDDGMHGEGQELHYTPQYL